MGQKVKNILKGVSVGGNYIGGNSTVNHYYGYQAEAGIEGGGSGKTIFLSFNQVIRWWSIWHLPDGDVVDVVCCEL